MIQVKAEDAGGLPPARDGNAALHYLTAKLGSGSILMIDIKRKPQQQKSLWLDGFMNFFAKFDRPPVLVACQIIMSFVDKKMKTRNRNVNNLSPWRDI